MNVLQDWQIIIPELNLKSEAELWVSLDSLVTDAIVNIKTTLTIEQADEIVSKLISNMKILRQSFSLDALLKGPINVDFINQTVTLFDCSKTFSRNGNDSLVTHSTLEKLLLLIGDCLRDLRPINVRHNTPSFPVNYTTQPPSGERNILDWWYINTEAYPGSHFATYPRALVEPCIKAGTSERGCCPKCGQGWRRVVEKDFTASSAGRINITGQSFMDGWEGVPRGINRVETLGFAPACTCDAGDPVPAVVLDPFAGSGTTLMVARQLGRNAVGLDLSLPYLRDQARSRLSLSQLDAWTNGRNIELTDLGPLFDEAT
jgi:hypothetical protein